MESRGRWSMLGITSQKLKRWPGARLSEESHVVLKIAHQSSCSSEPVLQRPLSLIISRVTEFHDDPTGDMKWQGKDIPGHNASVQDCRTKVSKNQTGQVSCGNKLPRPIDKNGWTNKMKSHNQSNGKWTRFSTGGIIIKQKGSEKTQRNNTHQKLSQGSFGKDQTYLLTCLGL